MLESLFASFYQVLLWCVQPIKDRVNKLMLTFPAFLAVASTS